MEISNTSPQDLAPVYKLFDQSADYQEKHGYPSWRNYDKEAIRQDIQSGNQYKIMIDGEIGIVFSVRYEDRIIWREKERGDALYLHRIVVNPEFKGQRLFSKVLHWAIDHAKTKGMRFVRMDTWASNGVIIAYYTGFGFGIVENFTTSDNTELPVHNRNLTLTLLEYPVH